MKENLRTGWLRNITTACLAMVIFTTSSMIALAGTPENKSLMGEITVSGSGNASSVILNGEAAATGRTFFSSGTIVTPDAVNSTVKLGKLGYVSLTPNTSLTLSFDEKTISGTLSAGEIRVYNAEGVNINIQTNAGAVTNESSYAKTFTVNAAKAARQDDDKDDDGGIFHGSAAGPILVFGGIVAAAIIIVVLNDDNNNNGVVSTTR